MTDLGRYRFTCRNGVALPSTVVNCSDDGLHLAVKNTQNESSCNCKESKTMKSFSTDFTTETMPPMKSTNKNSQRKTTGLTETEHNNTINDGIDLIEILNWNGNMDKKYNNILPKSHMHTINGGFGFTKTLRCNGKLNKKYKNIPPESHMHTLNGGFDFIKH
ncbi:unnamed protein product [Mytilus edulis]|uniref:Uncharacterized protein n=1 Tax=Mytilus edulis TaxID=6550 RepID=A0A8S3VAR0_MYTED|nr:unnamed protein product [Mytilus edulis]